MSTLNKKECWHCGKTAATEDSPLMRCVRCQTALYCSHECQVTDWKSSKNGGGDHKKKCQQLQAKKIEKGEQKAEAKSIDNSMTNFSEEMLGPLAELVARAANDPNSTSEQRARMQKFSRRMESAMALDAKGRIEWLKNPENITDFDDILRALCPLHNGSSKAHVLMESKQSTGNPMLDNTFIVYRYLGISLASNAVPPSKEKPKFDEMPKSVVEIVKAIEPVFDALEVLFYENKVSTSPSASVFLAKLGKLKAKVQEYNSMKTSDQRAYSRDSLFMLQETWKTQVDELHTMAMAADFNIMTS